MRKFMLVFLLLLLPACAFGPQLARQATAAPIGAMASPPSAEATVTLAPSATRVGRTRAGTPTADPSAPSTTGGDLRGIYVDSNAFPIPKTNEAALSQALDVPGVDGLVLVIGGMASNRPWGSMTGQRWTNG